jgi:MYXO-CTERM domain-containing protein
LHIGEVAQAAQRRGTEVTQQDISRHGAGESSPGANAVDNADNFGGFYDFQVRGLTVPNMSVPVVIALKQDIPADAVVRLYKPLNGWQSFVSNGVNKVQSASADEFGVCPLPLDERYVDGLQEGHQCVQITLQDGGPNDSDIATNYVIKALVAVAVLKEAAGSDAVRSPCGQLICSSSSGGGGNIGPWVVVLLVLLWSARRYVDWRGRAV